MQRQTARFWITRGEDDLTDHSRRGPRPRRVKIDKRILKRKNEENGYTHTRPFAELFKLNIKNHLHHSGVYSEHLSNQEILTDDDKIARLNFAQKYLDFDWSRTIFCGARTFHYNQDGSLHISSYNTEEDATIPNNAANIWGWMTADGVGELCPLPPQTSRKKYIDLLQNDMLPTVRNVYPENEMPHINVIQDNYSLNKEKTLRDWFRSRPEIKTILWPSKCSDLNPMENLWGLMVHRWYIGTVRTRAALEQHCNMIWEEMRGIDVCGELVESMRDLLQAVIEAKGGYAQCSNASS